MTKIAIVGFGFMGRMHYGNWKKIRGAKVVAICDANLAQLTTVTGGNIAGSEATTDLSGVDIYDDFAKMVAAGGFNESSFKISSSTAALIGDTIYCTITGEMTGVHAGKPAVKLYLGSRDDKDKSSAVSGSVNGLQTTFSFGVSADKQGTSIPVVIGFADGSWDENQDFFLNIPSFGRAFDPSYYTDGVYDLYGNAYPYLDKADNRGFPVDTQSTLTVSGETVTIKWVTRASDTDKI